jgi:protoheme IX farnesyltransferase
LIKSLQTALLLVTGLAGYLSVHQDLMRVQEVLAVTGSLFLAISGSTVLNMWYDRDIDSRMPRTCWRPLPSGQVGQLEALYLGAVLSILGVGWALAINWLYGGIVFAGIFFDVVVYTICLKRRTAWSIIWGGIAGGMPVLAGRALAVGRIDWIGVLLAGTILCWIPTHILTFNMRYYEDYKQAHVPVFPTSYGFKNTRTLIALSSILAVVTMGAAAIGIGLTAGYLRLLVVLSSGLLFLALSSLVHPSDKINFGLFKYASLYMLSSMLMIVFEIL